MANAVGRMEVSMFAYYPHTASNLPGWKPAAVAFVVLVLLVLLIYSVPWREKREAKRLRGRVMNMLCEINPDLMRLLTLKDELRAAVEALFVEGDRAELRHAVARALEETDALVRHMAKAHGSLAGMFTVGTEVNEL